jgi:hypothetical protein
MALSQVDLSSAKNFEDLFQRIKNAISGIAGIGELAVYDIAHRLGEYLGIPPVKVYLHSGARVGARALSVSGETAPVTDFPTPFHSLSAAEVEDCICIYKSRLIAIAREEQRDSL